MMAALRLSNAHGADTLVIYLCNHLRVGVSSRYGGCRPRRQRRCHAP